jgi:hypothetical protein
MPKEQPRESEMTGNKEIIVSQPKTDDDQDGYPSQKD